MSASGHQQPVRSLSPEGLLPDAYQPFNWRLSNRCILNVSTYYKQPLELLKKRWYEGRESARTGPSSLQFVPSLDQYWHMSLTLLTDRLRLTPLVDADIDLSLEIFTDPVVVKYVCDLMTEAQIRQEMSNWTKRGGNGGIGIWRIAHRKTGEKFGSALLLPMPIDEDDTDYSLVVLGEMPNGDIEIGYCLKRSAWGQGYATEACRRLLRFAFEETPLNEVVASFNEENVPSKRVLEKSGLVDRGHMRCYGKEGPNFRITRDEWNELQKLV